VKEELYTAIDEKFDDVAALGFFARSGPGAVRRSLPQPSSGQTAASMAEHRTRTMKLRSAADDVVELLGDAV